MQLQPTLYRKYAFRQLVHLYQFLYGQAIHTIVRLLAKVSIRQAAQAVHPSHYGLLQTMKCLQRCFLYHRSKEYMGIEIDTPEDLERAERLIER